MILSPRFSVSLDLSRDYITLSISSYLPLYRPLSFSLSFYLTFCLFLHTYPFLCLFFTDVRLFVSLRLSLSGSVSLSLPFPLSLSFSPFLSHPAPLYLFPSLLLSLTLPLSPCLSLPSRPLSSSQSRCWFLSALADIYIYIRLHIRDGALCNDYVYRQLGRSPQPTAIFSTAIKPASSQFISFDVHFCCELSLYFPIREQEWPQGE